MDYIRIRLSSLSLGPSRGGGGRRLERENMRESYCTRRREREGGGTVSKKCHFRNRLLFSLPHYISILWASVGANALQIYVSCQSLSTRVWPRSPVYVFTSAKLSVALFLLESPCSNTMFKGDLFTHVHCPLPLSAPGFPLLSVVSAAYGKRFTVELCKQTVPRLLLLCLTHEHKAADIKRRLEMRNIMSPFMRIQPWMWTTVYTVVCNHKHTLEHSDDYDRS